MTGLAVTRNVDDDAELLAGIAGGSEAAFTELVARYRHRFFSIARRMLGHDGDAEDAVQTAFLRVLRHAAAYRDEWQGSTWLYRVVTNVCVDQWRKRERRRETLETREAETRAPRSERVDVDRALAKLPPEGRVILVLCYVEGLSYAEIAAARGITINTVKTHLLRAKRLMRKHLSEGPP